MSFSCWSPGSSVLPGRRSHRWSRARLTCVTVTTQLLYFDCSAVCNYGLKRAAWAGLGPSEIIRSDVAAAVIAALQSLGLVGHMTLEPKASGRGVTADETVKSLRADSLLLAAGEHFSKNIERHHQGLMKPHQECFKSTGGGAKPDPEAAEPTLQTGEPERHLVAKPGTTLLP